MLQSALHADALETPQVKVASPSIRGPVFLALLLAMGVVVFFLTDVRPAHIQQVIRSFGLLAPVLYVVFYVLSCVIVFPASIMSVAGGLTFGPVWGTVLTLIGATLGASAAFFVARRLGREAVAKLVKGRLATFDETVVQHGFKVVLLMRFVPFPFVAVNYGAGLSRIRFTDFFLATLIGIVPGTFAFNLVGSSLTNIYSREFLYAVLLVVAVLGAPILYRWWQGKRIFTLKP